MRKLMPRLSSLLVLVALLAAHPAHAQVKPLKGWQQMRSANFYLIGDVGEADLRQVAGRLEQFRAAVGVILPKAILTAATPTTVFVFRSHRNYEPFKPIYNGKPAEHVAGYFLPGEAANFITLTIETRGEGGDDERFGIIYHELVHLMVSNTVRGLPVWFNEGLAEYYRTLQVTGSGQQVLVGRIHSPHVLLLREQFLPVEQLVAVDHGSPLYNEGSKASIFYAESWALVHYLLIGQNQKYAPKAGLLLEGLSSGMPFAEACQRALGISVAQLQKELRAYVARESFSSIQWTFAERLAALERLASTPLSDADAHAAAGALLLRMGRDDDARTHLERALSLDPGSAPAHSTLGMLYAQGIQLDLARTHLQQAAGGTGATAQTHFHLATTLQRIKKGEDDPGVDVQIEAGLRQAIALDPAYAAAYAQLARVLDRRPGDGAEVFALQQKAIALAPGREDYMLNLAYYLSNRQQFADATTVATALASGASDEQVRSNAADLLKRISDFERRKASNQTVEHRTDGPRVGRLDLRPVAAGEAQLKGLLLAIECPRGQIRLVVEHESQLSRVHAKAFDGIEFITYREPRGGNISCGERPEDDYVLVTYRPAPQGGSLGEVVAVEFVPAPSVPR
jgi:Flp pilus assembly protein TadD